MGFYFSYMIEIFENSYVELNLRWILNLGTKQFNGCLKILNIEYIYMELVSDCCFTQLYPARTS